MQIAIGFAVLFAVIFFGSAVCFGYPTVVKRISLALYRHAVKTERIHLNMAAKLNEAWVRTMEASGAAD